MKSIQSKILTSVIAGLLVVTSLLSYITVNMTHKVMHKDADRILNNMVQKEAALINDALGDVELSARILESYTATELSSPEELWDLEFRSEYLQKTKQMFTKIALNNPRVKGFYMRFNPMYTTNTTGFYTLIKADGSLQDMIVTDLAKYGESDGKNVGWYYDPIAAGEAIWLDPYYFPGYDHLLMSYASPIYVDGKLLGVIGFDMNFEALQERIDEIQVYDEGYAVLVSKDGQTRYNNEEAELGKDPYTIATAELVNGMKLELYAAYKDIQHDAHPLLNQLVAVFAVGMLCAAIYTVLVTRKIVKPLKRLIRVAENLSVGNQIAEWMEIDVDERDEIGILYRVLKTTYQKCLDYIAHINALAYRDSLTGIRNSTAHAEEISRLNHEIICGEPRFGVLVADINNLKQTNDRYGHDVGNALIIHAARILEEVFTSSMIFRIGGDEFAITLTGEDYDHYQAALARLDKACEMRHINVRNNDIQLSLARGVSLFDRNGDKVYEDVFNKADKAMYRHKEQKKADLVGPRG